MNDATPMMLGALAEGIYNLVSKSKRPVMECADAKAAWTMAVLIGKLERHASPQGPCRDYMDTATRISSCWRWGSEGWIDVPEGQWDELVRLAEKLRSELPASLSRDEVIPYLVETLITVPRWELNNRFLRDWHFPGQMATAILALAPDSPVRGLLEELERASRSCSIDNNNCQWITRLSMQIANAIASRATPNAP